jgi:hypothetical protein
LDAPVVAGAPIEHLSPLIAYRITYRIDAGKPIGANVTTETLSVLRPWGSLMVTRSGPPPGGAVTDQLTSDFGKLRVTPASGAPTVVSTPPDLAASDLRLDITSAEIVAGGLARWAERRRVLSRDCQVLVTTAPPQGQQLGALRGAHGDQVLSCIDANGLILEQLVTSSGTLLLRREAVQVDTAPQLDPVTFSVQEAATTTTADGGGSVVQVPPSTLPPGPTWFLDHPPAGFTFQGHYAVAEPTSLDINGQPSSNRRAGFTDVWTAGAGVLILDQGGTLFGSPAFSAAPGARPVALGALGTGEEVPGARLGTVRVAMADGRYIRLAGTLPLDQLATLARTLRRADAPA